MPTAKKKTKPTVKSKKTVAKKKPAETKKPAVKKAAAPTVAPPVVAPWNPMKISLCANNGEYTLTFADEASFHRALDVVASAPTSGGGSRSGPSLLTVNTKEGLISFHVVTRYTVSAVK